MHVDLRQALKLTVPYSTSEKKDREMTSIGFILPDIQHKSSILGCDWVTMALSLVSYLGGKLNEKLSKAHM